MLSSLKTGTPWFFELRSSKSFIIVTLAIAFFFDTFYYGLIIPILPRLLDKRVHVGDDTAQLWTAVLLATYCFSQILSAPAIGYLADRWSNRRLPLLIGLIALAISNAMFAYGRDIALLVIARFLQGASAAIIWAVGLALLVDTVGSDEMPSAMSWVTISLSVGLTSGPLLGGIVYKRAGHYAVFAVAIAILLVDLVLRILLIEKKDAEKIIRKREGRSEDTSRPASAHRSSIEDGQDENTPLISRPQQSSATDHPSAFWSLLTSRDLLIGLWAILIVNMCQTSLEATFSWSSEDAGLSFLALMIPAFTGPIAGATTSKYGARANTIFGLILCGVGYGCLTFVRSSSLAHVALLSVMLFVLGTGISFVNVAQMSTLASLADKMELETPGIFGPNGATAQSCSLLNGAFALAGITGPSLGGALRQQFGWQVMAIVLSGISFVSILPMLRLRK